MAGTPVFTLVAVEFFQRQAVQGREIRKRLAIEWGVRMDVRQLQPCSPVSARSGVMSVTLSIGRWTSCT